MVKVGGFGRYIIATLALWPMAELCHPSSYTVNVVATGYLKFPLGINNLSMVP